MPAALNLPEAEIVNRWISEIASTTRTLAVEYGCSDRSIAAILHRHLDRETIRSYKRAKISRSTAARPDLKTEEWREMCRYASSRVTPEGRQRTTDSLRKAAIVSADRRRGVRLSA